jgi:hypothetical protein
MHKQKLYIIGHNPNTLQEAEDFLRAGANALEPDICYDAEKPERFFVSHGTIGSNPFTAEHSLVTYLAGLRQLLGDPANNINLALIAFDTKTPSFNINEFIHIVFENFSRFEVCRDVAILITVGSISDIAFLNRYDQTKENVAVGIDEESSPADVEEGFKSQGQRSFTYANGNLIPAIKFGLFKSIMTAKGLQARAGDNGFKLIYAWVLNSESYLRSYLDLHIDGMIVDQHTVPHLIEIMNEDHFAGMYELAQNGYNPFAAIAPPRYLLTIKTSDTHMAGTDVPVKFTLEGSGGLLESTLDCDFRDVMERGDTDYLVLEGKDIGDIESLTIAELSSGLNSGWLPESIRLESNLIQSSLTFGFNPDEWLRFGQPITKKPSASG